MFRIVPISGDFHFLKFAHGQKLPTICQKFCHSGLNYDRRLSPGIWVEAKFPLKLKLLNQGFEAFSLPSLSKGIEHFCRDSYNKVFKDDLQFATWGRHHVCRGNVFNSLTLLLGSQNSFLIMFQSDSPLNPDHKQMWKFLPFWHSYFDTQNTRYLIVRGLENEFFMPFMPMLFLYPTIWWQNSSKQ